MIQIFDLAARTALVSRVRRMAGNVPSVTVNSKTLSDDPLALLDGSGWSDQVPEPSLD